MSLFLMISAPVQFGWTQSEAEGAVPVVPAELAPVEPGRDFGRPPRGSDRTIRPVTVDQPPVIDGVLNEDEWFAAPESGKFWVTTEEYWPAERTEVMVLTDDQFLYVAFRAYDSQPDKIVARETVRDRGLGFDDQVIVEIDSFGKREGISRFLVNARGTQSDDLAGGRASRISWKGDWEVAVGESEEGWVAEFAIPYEILNYRPGVNEFGINFGRYHHRSKEWSRWADITPQNRPEEMGRLVGLSTPLGPRNSTWTVMPFVLAGKNVIDREGEFQDELFTGGVDILFTPKSNMTGVLSLNPDFTQVETQITDANFSYNEKAVPDPRVFFQEGADYYGRDNRIFYSPRVPDFNGGGKMFGQEGSFRYGGLVTFSPDSRTDGVARLSYALDATHSASAIFVGTNRDELDGTTISVAAEGREKIGTYWNAQFASTSNRPDGESSVSGSQFDVRGGWQGDHWGAGIQLDDYDKEFDPANGLIRTDHLGTTGRDAFVNYYRRFDSSGVSEVTMDLVQNDRETDDGRTQYSGWYASSTVEWSSYVRTGLSYSDGDYRPLSGEGPGEFSDQVNDDNFWTASLDFGTQSSILGYGASYSSGELGGGDYEYIFSYVWTRPTDNTSLSVSAERLESFGTFRQYITQAGWDINQFNALVFRHIYSDGDQFWRLGYRRVVRSGLDIFLLYDEEPEQDAAISLKLLWTIF